MKKKLFSEFAVSELASPLVVIDGVSSGTFTDMWGETFTFDEDELPRMVDNTNYAIESTADSQGEVIGFPIDQRYHNHGDAAGFIKRCEMSQDGKKIRFHVEWNDVGKALIDGNIMRYFSPSIDLEAWCVIGGSLTNYPAMRSANHRYKLAPVEASVGMFSWEDDPQGMNILERIEAMFSKLFTSDQVIKPGTDDIQMEEQKSMMTIAELQATPEGKAELERYTAQRLAEAEAVAVRKQGVAGLVESVQILQFCEAQEFETIALTLDGNQFDFVKRLIEATGSLKAKLDTMTEELGHSGKMEGKKELPQMYADQLRTGAIKVSDLSNPILAPVLGDISDYDLSEFTAK